jgi:hypothetical protein
LAGLFAQAHAFDFDGLGVRSRFLCQGGQGQAGDGKGDAGQAQPGQGEAQSVMRVEIGFHGQRLFLKGLGPGGQAHDLGASRLGLR